MTSNLRSNSLLNENKNFESQMSVPIMISNQAACKEDNSLLASYVEQSQRVVLKDQSSLIDLSGIRDVI